MGCFRSCGSFQRPAYRQQGFQERYRADNLIEDYLGKIEEKIEKEVAKGRKKFGENFDEAKFRETNPNVLREKLNTRQFTQDM